MPGAMCHSCQSTWLTVSTTRRGSCSAGCNLNTLVTVPAATGPGPGARPHSKSPRPSSSSSMPDMSSVATSSGSEDSSSEPSPASSPAASHTHCHLSCAPPLRCPSTHAPLTWVGAALRIHGGFFLQPCTHTPACLKHCADCHKPLMRRQGLCKAAIGLLYNRVCWVPATSLAH